MDKAFVVFYLVTSWPTSCSMRGRGIVFSGYGKEGVREAIPPGFRMDSTMTNHPWVVELPVAITVMDDKGVILEMNNKSIAAFASDGGAALIGRNGLDCHPEPSRSKLQQLLAQPKTNSYTIEKAGVKKLISQIPWYRDGKFSGIVELSIEIPAGMPHFVRQ